MQLRPVTPAACFHGFILWFRAGVACAGFQRSAEQETDGGFIHAHRDFIKATSDKQHGDKHGITV